MAPPYKPPANPYQEQTDHNTGAAWLDGHKPVDVDIDGMVDFARNMATVKDNLDGSTGYLDLLGSLPTQAWDGGALGEAMYVAQMMGFHYSEFRQYFAFLSQGLNNIGMAAQTVADAFQGTDGWSAATLDAVEFAYGDTGEGKPPGLPPGFPVRTWQQAFDENVAKGNGAASGQLDHWTLQSTVSAGLTTVKTYVNQDGMTRTDTSPSGSSGSSGTTTTTLRDADGNVISSSSQASRTDVIGDTVVTTTTSYDGNNHRTGSRTEETTYSGDEVTKRSTQTRGPDDKVTGTTTTETNSDGTQTITTTSGNNKRVVEIGEETEGETSGSLDSPARDAMDDIKTHNYPIAPWALG
ncbi:MULTISPECIES: hypothetical protein [Protofrankia]|uniref:Uncharacterized protein n=1 Tax=Candidatus Protofrankia datiscae TaxID=2716812 RepID=F8B2R3_9ACTN|nr:MULTISPECIES: hypothetical protein [Protofrankia]AEH07785.1 hypothetical protein FsymDg_0213 [Candidatus Protofrankia datiscae]